MNEGQLFFFIMLCVVMIIGNWPRRRPCSRCGRNCAGRMAGGTIDSPLCVACVEKERE